LVQHSLVTMLEMAREGVFTEELVIDKMCHAPADLFHVKDRGYLRKGYFADFVLIDPSASWTVAKENIVYKCGWSPLEGTTFHNKIYQTWVNGNLVFDNGVFDEKVKGMRLNFSPLSE
jgi:dihydroorotase